MAFLTLDGSDVSVAASSQSVVFVGGEDSRCYNGAIMRNQRRRVREWSLTTIPLTPSASATLQTLLANSTLSMNGTMESAGTISVRPEIQTVDQFLGAGGAILESVTFTLREI